MIVALRNIFSISDWFKAPGYFRLISKYRPNLEEFTIVLASNNRKIIGRVTSRNGGFGTAENAKMADCRLETLNEISFIFKFCILVLEFTAKILYWTLKFVTELNKVQFKVLEIFWTNNKTIIEFGFRMIQRIMQITILHNILSHIQ